ncbi:MAG: MMPL family transporter [Solirubrobacteraceae bacterium]
MARLSIRRPRAALTFWAILAVALALLGLGVSDSLSPSISVVPGSESSRAQQLSHSEFGPSVLVPILLEGSPAQLDRQGPKVVVALSKRHDTRVMSAWSRGDSGKALRPRPGAAMIVASVARSEKQMVETVQPQIERTVNRVLTSQVTAHITGQPTLDRALKDESIATTRQTELIAVGVLFVLLLIGLRTPVAAFVLSAFGAVTTLAGFGAMALLGKVIETDPLAVALASITGLALGVGFSLMIVDRFREEELLPGEAPQRASLAAATAVATTGRTILFSGTALIVALILATAIAPTPILTSIGIGVLLCSALATGAAVVVMPAVLTLLGPRIDAFAFPAPRLLASGWDWVVGRGRWVTRWAVAAGAIATALLVALAVPAAGLETGPPDISMLPASTQARQSFERVSKVMGPGWPTPYNLVVVSKKQPITAPALLPKVHAFQAKLARDKRVDSVVGPGAFVAQSKDLKALPKGLKSSAKLLKGGKKDLGRLEKGLGQAGDGAGQLRAGLASAADGAGKLQAGSGTAGSGAGKLHAGLGQARAGAAKISAGLRDALAGANALKKGSAAALAGSEKLAGGLGQAAKPVREGLPVFKQLAAAVAGASTTVTAANGAAQSVSGQVDGAIAALRSMTAGKSDPRYGATLDALNAARTAAGGVQSALAGVQPKLAGAAGISAAAAKQVGDLSVGLGQLYAGSNDLQGGIAKLRKGNADLAGGIAKLSTGGGQLTTGLGALNDGAAALQSGLGQLTSGAGDLQSGLASGQGPTGELVGGLGKLEAGVAKFRGALPSTKDIEQLQRESPGLFDSGYFVLAAIQGAPPADRNLASFAVNLDRGGNAGQIVVIPRLAARTKTTRALGEDLKDSAASFAKASGTEVAVGGPAGDLADFTSETNARLPIAVAALALGVALVLMIALKTILLPLVAVAFDALVALATFGAMTRLFGGDDPILGGPGYLDPMSIIGIFAAIFGISIAYEVLLLARTREHFTESGDARAALAFGLRRTAAVATGAAAVMVAAAVPFAFSDIINVRQFGIGLAIAATLDALVVRPVLLPAAVQLMGRWSWWPTTALGVPPVSRPVPPLAPKGAS